MICAHRFGLWTCKACKEDWVTRYEVWSSKRRYPRIVGLSEAMESYKIPPTVPISTGFELLSPEAVERRVTERLLAQSKFLNELLYSTPSDYPPPLKGLLLERAYARFTWWIRNTRRRLGEIVAGEKFNNGDEDQ